KIELHNEKVIIAAVPYLRDGDIRRAVAGESFNELTDKYKTALINHYKSAAKHCKAINITEAPVIAMGHLFATGGSVSDSEQNIYVGTLGHIGAEDFPVYFDYVALGHLHRPQIIGKNDTIRYSGSPHILSFSEISYEKQVVVLTLENNKISTIENVIIPRFREFYQLKGTLTECINLFPTIISNAYKLTPWVEIILHENNTVHTDDLEKTAEKYMFEILKIALKNQYRSVGIEELFENTKSIKELLPTEVFKLKCEEMGFDLQKTPKIWDAFNEILQSVKKQ
ncbi:MAG: exonuclease SbcCD subunit D C-terminal domain-containing protein, partial [Polaribacter sp.]